MSENKNDRMEPDGGEERSVPPCSYATNLIMENVSKSFFEDNKVPCILLIFRCHKHLIQHEKLEFDAVI